ncbi:MAG: hypothetical protein NWF04_09205 [Candidatus Bathyarchaeota archaeon]|nr:hypothetical protein [Candidatus Bathyarchaeota archaeon]
MKHAKLVSLALMLAIFGSVGAVSWAIMNSHAQTPLSPQEQARDAAMDYIKTNHPETMQFITELAWTGGRQDSGLLGAETYIYQSEGWTLTIKYPVVANPIYEITVDYSTTSTQIGIPYHITWTGTYQNGCATEASYIFAQ